MPALVIAKKLGENGLHAKFEKGRVKLYQMNRDFENPALFREDPVKKVYLEEPQMVQLLRMSVLDRMKSFLDGATNVPFSYQLGNLQYATANVFQGSKYCHIRKYYVTAEGSERPTRQGVVLRVSLCLVLFDLVCTWLGFELAC